MNAITATVSRDFPTAINSYRQLVELDPNKPEVYADLGRAYEKAGDSKKAIESYLQATSKGPQYAPAFLRLGYLQGRDENMPAAEAAFKTASDLYQKQQNTEGQTEVFYQRGQLYNQKNRIPEARQQLQQALDAARASNNDFQRIRSLLQLASVATTEGKFEEAHQHLDHARRLLDSLEDVTGVAQVDESRACVFLKQGQVVEAERIVRSAVHTQEQSGRHALLAEALITHGRALARLENYGEALSAFRRAIQLSEHTGDRNRAAEAAFAVFQEMGQHLAIFEGEKFISGRTLNEEVSSFEHDTLKLALENSQGSVTRAARSLGMSHQALTYILESRHNDLLKYMKPQRRRPRRYKN